MAALLSLVMVMVAMATVGAAPYPPSGPVIGVLGVPVSEGCSTVAARNRNTIAGTAAEGLSGSCFESVYVKWLEQSGARVAPIQHDLSEDALDAMLESVNGVLFTGGGLSLLPNTTYYKTALHILQKTIAFNDAGDYFPLHGTCMGFQLLNILTSGNWSILERYAFDSEDISLPLDLTSDGLASRLITQAPAAIAHALTTEPITSNLHHDGVSPAGFYASTKLTDFYRLVSTNKDRKGKPFASTIEAKNYPISGTQWHPERPQYEFSPELNVSHTVSAITAMQYVSSYFVNEARKNTHSFPNAAAEAKALIYNYPPSADPSGVGYQVYKF